jgi:membrane-associated phospholipid phosphatase
VKKLSSPIAILVAVWTTLAIIFAFADWQISQALYSPEAGWAHFMEAYGQVPGSLLGVISAGILLRLYKVEKSVKSIAGVIGLGVLAIFTSFGMSADLLGAQVDPDNLNMVALLVLTLAVVIVVQVALRRFSYETVSQYKTAAKAGLMLMFFAGFITVWAIKIPWGRWTYRDILEAGNIALFTPWYLPQGNNGHHSFISGHTALSFVVMGYLYFLARDNSKKNILLAAFLLWGIIGGMSRIVVGAHYASDVLFGAGETLFWFLLLAKHHQLDYA